MTETTNIPRVAARHIWPLALLALAIAIGVQLIGTLTIDLGIGSISIFPMVWGLVIGAVVSIQRIKPLGIDIQRLASAFVGIAVMLLVGRLAFVIGPSLDVLIDAGPALLLQEVGHLLGTVALALPLAVALRMGRATVGATFSIDREPSFAMVRERFGPDSDEFRGVLAMYVFGTLFGAVFITLLASFVASAGWFDPLALAMGAGVGSGSMMAAASGSIVAQFPAQEQEILALAATSNLITTILGVYVGIWIALPLADRFYRLLTRTPAKTAATVDSGAAPIDAADETDAAHDDTTEAQRAENRRFAESVAEAAREVRLPLLIGLPVLTVIGVVTASIAAGGFDWAIVGGYLMLDALIVISALLAKLTRVISAIVWATTIGALISSPWSPIGEATAQIVGSVDFLSIATVVLTFAGLSLGKDVPLLRQIGWKIIPVGIVAISASFLLSTVIAEFTLGFWG